jgi:hypothetical protein
MKSSRVPIHCDRSSNTLDGRLVLAQLVGNQSEIMDRIDVIWLNNKDLPVDLLGSLQTASPMVLDRNRQCFGNRCHAMQYILDFRFWILDYGQGES